jgi:hypothetical protein
MGYREKYRVWRKFRNRQFSFDPKMQDNRDIVLGWSLWEVLEETRMGTKNYVPKSQKLSIPVQIRDQKDKNTCVLESYSMQRDENDKFGSMFSVAAGTAYLVSQGTMSSRGTSLSAAHKMKYKIGWVLESDYPTYYGLNWNKFSENLWTPDLYERAKKYKTNGFYKTYDINLIQENLDKGIVGHTALMWYSSYNYANNANPVLKPNAGNEIGGHAIDITGRDYVSFSEPMFEFATSFGTDYGKQGNFYIPIKKAMELLAWGVYYDSDLSSQHLKWLSENKGKLVKDPNSPAVYYIDGVKKKHIPDEYLWYWTAQNFTEDATVNQIPSGEDFSINDLSKESQITFDRLTNWIKNDPKAVEIIKKY